MNEIVNAQIEATSLGYEDHGILTCMLHLKWPGAGVGFGGLAMDTPNGKSGRDFKREGTAFGMSLVAAILETVGVENWEDLPGKYVRVVDGGCGSRCRKIGHLLENKWLDLDEFVAKFK